MAGFADLFGQAAHQQVSSFDNGGLKNGMVSAGGPAKPAVAKMQGGGPAGFLYNNLVQPFANSTANLTSDISGLVGGAATAVNDVAHGKRGDNMVQSYLKSTPVGQAYQAGGGGGKGLEMAAGNLGSDVLNVATPFIGPEAAAGKVGARALIGAGLKTGAALGGASGITNAMAAGDTASQIAGAGTGGALTGGLVGGALGGAGAVGGKLINRVAQGKAAPAAETAATKDLVGGNIAKKAQVRGAMDAQNQLAQQTEPFKLPGAREGVSKATAFDKQGNPVSLKPIVNGLQFLKMTPETTGLPLEGNMQNLHDILVPSVFRHMSNATEGIKVDASNAMDVGTQAIRTASGLGRFSKNGTTGAANETRQRIEQALNGLGSSSTVKDVLGAISNLQGEQARLAPSIAAQEPVAVRQRLVYQDVIDHLDSLLSKENVDHAIAQHQLGTAEQDALRQDVINAGGSHELANHIINGINNMQSYAEGRSLTQPGVIAGQLAKVANVAQAEAPFEAVKPTTGGIGSIPAQLAIGVKHPGYMPFALANLAKAGAAGVQGAVAKRLAPASYEAGLQSVTGPTEATANKFDISQPQQFENTGTSQISFNGQTPEVPIPVARTEMQTVETPTQLQNQIPLNETPEGATQRPITVNNPLGANLGGGLPETTSTQVPVRRTSAPQPTGKTPILHGLTTPGRVPVEQPPPPGGGGTPPPAAPSGFTPPNSLIGALTGLRNVSAQQTGAAVGTPSAPAAQPQDQTQQADLTGATGAGQGQQADPYSLQNLQADIARDPKNATTYMDIYKTFHAATAPAKATAAQVASAQAITDGYAALAAANDQIQGFGGTGPQNAPGTLPLVGGFINKNVSAYERTRIDLATALAKALTGRSAVPHSLVNQYMNSIPDATTPPAQAQQMLANLQQQLDLRAQHEAQLNPAAAQLVGGASGQ